MPTTPREILHHRIQQHQNRWLNIRTDLRHFALINYALPAERLAPHIPERFEIPTFPVNGQLLAMMSAVPFLDVDFRYYQLFPFLKFHFPQTNYRVYVIDRETGEHVVWFFGTTLGSWLVYFARLFWRIPWHFARYTVDCQYDPVRKAYQQYHFEHTAPWASAFIELEDTGQPVQLTPGFPDLDLQKLILTHPVDGFYYRLDQKLGTYSVWHEEMQLTSGRARQLYFSLYERLGLLTRAEMAKPHSIFICPKITFDVYLPPQEIK